jgi:hypothetical protein
MKTRWAWISAGVGMALTVWAAVAQFERYTEQASQLRTTGKVVALSADGCVAVEFLTEQGQSVRIRGSVCSRPNDYEMGGDVPVVYAPEAAQKARIDTFGENWFFGLLVGGMGVLFLFIGGVMLVLLVVMPKVAKRREGELALTGQAIYAQVMGAEPNMAICINGKYPWRVVAQWLNPATNKLHLFYSPSLWYDPSPYLPEKQVQVWIDPQRPKRYSMDTSFLPELA